MLSSSIFSQLSSAAYEGEGTKHHTLSVSLTDILSCTLSILLTNVLLWAQTSESHGEQTHMPSVYVNSHNLSKVQGSQGHWILVLIGQQQLLAKGLDQLSRWRVFEMRTFLRDTVLVVGWVWVVIKYGLHVSEHPFGIPSIVPDGLSIQILEVVNHCQCQPPLSTLYFSIRMLHTFLLVQK